MYDQLSVTGFRGIRNLKIDHLAQVSLFVGPNNVGKTSLLEAAWLLTAPGNPSLLISLAQFRGISMLNVPGIASITPGLLWTPMFHGGDSTGEINIRSVQRGAIPEELTIRLDKGPQALVVKGLDVGQLGAGSDPTYSSRSPIGVLETLEYVFKRGADQPIHTRAEAMEGRINFPNIDQSLTRFASYLSTRRGVSESELADSFTKLEDTGATDVLISALRTLDESLLSLSLGFIDGRPVIRGHFRDRPPLPLYFLGDGAAHLANIILHISTARDGTVMIDEIENGIYYKNLHTCWEAVRRACRLSNAQIFATTHSRECAMAAARVFREDSPDTFGLYRLENRAEHTRVVAYNAQTAEAADEMDLEVR